MLYWNGNNHESIACDIKNSSSSIVPLDTFMLFNLKKINKPDTLTLNSLEKVWYVKINIDSIEFYTADGKYPRDNRKRLLPITRYILNKYVFKRKEIL